jgi:hypothetical protein
MQRNKFEGHSDAVIPRSKRPAQADTGVDL